MGLWNEPHFVNDDGLRVYFSEHDRGGPSRLECYRRLLASSADRGPSAYYEPRHISAGITSVRRFADLFHLPWSGWRAQTAGQELAGR